MKTKRGKLSDLTPDPQNARARSDEAVSVLDNLIAEFGVARSIVVDGDGKILAGNGTVAAAAKAGITKTIEVDASPDEMVVVRRSDMTGERGTMYALADNRTGELASWNSNLASQLDELADAYNLDDLGFDQSALDELIPSEPVEVVDTPADVSKADELAEQWGTAKGQLWEVKGQQTHRLLCGDCRDSDDAKRLIADTKINVAFTSPPYASQRKYDESSGFKPIPPDDYVKWFEPVQATVRDHLADDGSWFVNITEASSDGWKLLYVKRLAVLHVDEWQWGWVDEYCWPRPALPLNPNTSRRFKNGWESVYHFATSKTYKFNPDSVRHTSDGVFKYSDQKAAGKKIGGDAQGRGGGVMSPVNAQNGLAFPSNVLANMGGAKVVGHSAAFPVGLPSFFIRAFSDESDSVYDPFLGSGTTMLAAEQLNRQCFGMEISPGYVAVILQRMTDAGCECTKLSG